jgi:miniconductance mechanosensitive channel
MNQRIVCSFFSSIFVLPLFLPLHALAVEPHESAAVLVQNDAGERVAELQLSLNRFLGSHADNLLEISGIEVGPITGAPGHKIREARIQIKNGEYVEFAIYGDWTPLDWDEATEELKSVTYENGWSHPDILRLEHIPPPQKGLPFRGLPVDTTFGQHTRTAVILFQFAHSLPITGEVDVVTLDKLEPMIPTNDLLADIMDYVGIQLRDGRLNGFLVLFNQVNRYPLWVKRTTGFVTSILIFILASIAMRGARIPARSTAFLSRWLFTPESSPWFTALVRHDVFTRAAHIVPALFIILLALWVFPKPDPAQDQLPYLDTFQNWHTALIRFGLAYLSFVFMWVGFAIANTCEDAFGRQQDSENPISGVTRFAKQGIGATGTMLIIASLWGVNPFAIAGGIGAFVALIVLAFREYVLGLVASIQIIANKVVNIGDWITMPKYHANGDVIRMSLTLITVQNFDKTISTVPTPAVLSESFQNWTGMQQSGGRRIKRSILVDMHSIQTCSKGMLDRFEGIDLIREYVREKKREIEVHNRSFHEEDAALNSRELTNVGTFRAYVRAYLQNHPLIDDNMTLIVRQLDPTSGGLPIEVCAFSRETEWEKFENIQADIFDHLLAVLSKFELRAFQDLTDSRGITQGMERTHE